MTLTAKFKFVIINIREIIVLDCQIRLFGWRKLSSLHCVYFGFSYFLLILLVMVSCNE